MINSEGTPVVDGQGDGQDTGLPPGKRLSQGRLQLGLTQEQVAKELYITLVKIKALESDDYGRLNTDTFTRGYIRAYANLVKIDVVEVLAAYDQLLHARSLQSAAQPGSSGALSEAGKPLQPAPASASAASSGSRSALQLLLIIAAFFLGLWLISVWFFNHQPDTNYTALSPVVSLYASSGEAAASSERASGEASSSAAQASARAGETRAESVGVLRAQSPLVPGSSLAAVSSAGSAKSRSASASSLPLAAGAQAAAQSAAETGAAAASSPALDKPKAVGLDTISFSFSAECWLEVSDSRGDVLATELQAAGSSLTLVGKAPFDVKLGNAPAVAIQLNSKKIDVIPLLGSNVLTLRVTE